MSTIGIDFGTTFTSASWVNPVTGFPEAITFPDAVDKCKIPSIVYFNPNGQTLVGFRPYTQIESASTSAERDDIHRHAISSIKRKMQQNGSFRGHSHVEIISLIIRHVVEYAKEVCNFLTPPDTLVITHPVVFAEWQKKMLKEAAVKAGFAESKISLLEEPVSAALAYVKSNKLPDVRGVLVYDFGGGTFDVAYVSIDHNGQLQIPVEPQGDPYCGGDDIDLVLYDNWEQIVNQKFNRSISSNPQEVDEAFLSLCRREKEQLSSEPNKKFSVLLPPIPGRGILEQAEWQVRSGEYDNLIAPIIDRTIHKTQSVVNELRRQNLPLDLVVLIGGSSRIPQVRKRLEQLLGDASLIKTTGHVDTAVAVGASYFGMQSPEPEPAPTPKSDNRAKFCIHCGHQFEEPDKFCIICGRPREIL